MAFLKGILSILIMGIIFSCEAQDCNKLDTNFISYESALKTIKSADFSITDKCNTSRSSWIKKAEFYSCNEELGYLIISTKSKTYIHKNVPLNIWKDFKKAESFGKFYNARIKGKYLLII